MVSQLRFLGEFCQAIGWVITFWASRGRGPGVVYTTDFEAAAAADGWIATAAAGIAPGSQKCTKVDGYLYVWLVVLQY
jgi:hypothetical protein